MSRLARSIRPGAIVALAFVLGACADVARLPDAASFGPRPDLPPADPPPLPTVNIAPAKGWRDGEQPVAAAGLEVSRFASGLDHPRGLYVLPNGDVLVTESDAPPGNQCATGFKGWIQGIVMKIAGSGRGSANRIALLRDADGDGVAELNTPLLQNLNSPFGIALIGSHLYVGNTDGVLRFPYQPGATSIAAPGETVTELPASQGNCHWTRSLRASRDGTKLYVAVGSNSDHGEKGVAAERGRAMIWEFDVASGGHRPFAVGLRNPVGMDIEPHSGALWAVVNERDELGSDLVPDYMTAVQQGADYGWPCRYYGNRVDVRVGADWPCEGRRAVVPGYALGTHTAPLGLAFSRGSALEKPLGAGSFVAQHGSWNRVPKSGYKVIFVPFAAGRPAGPPQDVLTGFLDEDDNARGRPVAVAIDARGALLVSDDVGNAIWRVAPARSRTSNFPRDASQPADSARPISSP